MKDQYFGDVNDYLKYGLLRALTAPGLTLGICWMLTPDDGRTDGGKTGYLLGPGWDAHDPELFEHLRRIVTGGGRREVAAIEWGPWLAGARFFGEAPPPARRDRESWSTRMASRLAGSDLVFFDPDNGLEVRSACSVRSVSPKHLLLREAGRAWADGASVLVFQHFPREPRGPYLERRLRELAGSCPGCTAGVFVTTSVAYLLAAQPRHAEALARGAREVAVRWRGRIEARFPAD